MPVTAGIVIAGTGFTGFMVGSLLTKAGYHDFVILEKDDLGRSWRDNQYRARTRRPRRGACAVTR